MSLGNPTPGPNSAAEYLVSGVPFFVTTSANPNTPLGIDLPFVTRDVIVRNTGTGSLTFGVTQEGVNGTGSFTIPSGASETFQIRTRRVFFKSTAGTTFSMCAGLTTVESRNFPLLTGSNGFAGV